MVNSYSLSYPDECTLCRWSLTNTICLFLIIQGVFPLKTNNAYSVNVTGAGVLYKALHNDETLKIRDIHSRCMRVGYMKLTDCEIVGAHVTKRTMFTDALTIMIADAARFSYKKASFPRRHYRYDEISHTAFITLPLS